MVLALLACPLAAQEPAPPAQPTQAVPSPPAAEALERPGPAPADDPTVSAPPIPASPAAGRGHARSGIVPGKPVSLSREAASTVMFYEKGKSLTVRTPVGMVVSYRLAKNASVPPDLAEGRAVLVETRAVRKRRYASRVTYAESRLVMTNVDDGRPR